MTRKDYQLIANAFCDSKPVTETALTQWKNDVTILARALATTNPRFDRERFLKACGIE